MADHSRNILPFGEEHPPYPPCLLEGQTKYCGDSGGNSNILERRSAMNLVAKGFDSACRARREMSIKAALEWAFSAERVSIEFDEINDRPPATDTIWRLMRQGMLGCRIDGGGRSLAHDDAEVIASFVGSLGPEFGGRGMAVRIAQLARCGAEPDWMPGARPRCVPVDVVQNPHGTFARTVVVGQAEVLRRGRKRKVDVLACPVEFAPRPATIAAARREYTAWWCALLELRVNLKHAGLRTISLTDRMPPRAPWEAGA